MGVARPQPGGRPPRRLARRRLAPPGRPGRGCVRGGRSTMSATSTSTSSTNGPAGPAPDREVIVAELARARARTLDLVDRLSDDEQRAQVSPLMSPLVWDLAHIGNYEELWLLRELDGRAAIDADLDDLYNAFEHPR